MHFKEKCNHLLLISRPEKETNQYLGRGFVVIAQTTVSYLLSILIFVCFNHTIAASKEQVAPLMFF